MSEADDPGEADGDDGGIAGREIWIEKYRPRTLDEIKGQERITERLQSYIEQSDLPHLLFSGPAGVGKCVTGGTPVLTNRGVERIESVVGDVEGFATPDAGLEVLTFDDDGSFRYVEPSHVYSRAAADLVAVDTRDGGALTVTPEHRLLVVSPDGLEWRRAAELEPGDRVVRPLQTPTPELDPSLDWVGAMDGDRTLVHLDDGFAERHGLDRTVRLGSLRAERLSGVAVDVDDASFRAGVDALQFESTSGNRSEPIEPIWELTPDLARFVGLIVSEARIEHGRVKFYNTDDDLLDAVADVLSERFGLEPTRSTQKDVPYVEVCTRTLTHLLESTFDVVASAAAGEGTAIGSTLVRADEASRAAFLRAVFDAEGYVSPKGHLELVQTNGDHVTLVSYLLSSLGVPSRRTTEWKTATNGPGPAREYHALYVSSASHLRRFADRVGFTVDSKAERLAEIAARDPNPNHDTIPAQRTARELCHELNLPIGELLTGTLDRETPGREAHLADVEAVVEAAVERLEAAQRVASRLDRLAATLQSVDALPATWVGERDALEPLATRKELAGETGVRTDRLLEYADGRRTPGASRSGRILAELDGVPVTERPAVPRLQRELADCIDALELEHTTVAEGTPFRGTDVGNLLSNDDHDVRTLTRFATVAERVRDIAAGACSLDVVERLAALDRLASADVYVDEVESVDRLDEERRVYDLTVPGTRNYVAGGVPTVMHNTTAATAIARTVYGDDWRGNFLELNASDERGIDVVRDRIKNFARASFGGHDYRIIFLDEADSLCLPPGTEVVTGSPSSPDVKPIEDVAEDGEPMPSVDFESNEVQSDRGRLVDSGVADFFEVELADGRHVTASLTHPFFVVGDDGRLVERELRELAPGDQIADFRDDVGVSRCEVCGAWTGGRFCSVDCKEGHSRATAGDDEHDEHDGREEFDPAVVSDGGTRAVSTVEVRSIEYSHRGQAYNVTMDGTPNFVLANGILTHNTDDAQSALRRTMEQFSDNTRFVLSCNYSSRIIDPIQSRCAVFRFTPLSDDAIAAQVREIAEAEGIELTDDGLDALVYAAGGDMRRAINSLQAAATTGDVVDEEAVYMITSTARPEEIREMVELALAGEFVESRTRLETLLTETGMAGGDVIDQLHRSVWEFDLDDRAAVRLMERIGEADYRITAGGSEQVQLEALLAALALDEGGA
jgi:DNA polymerase III delta prime subunit